MSNAVLTENEERLFGAAKEAEAEATQETKKQDVEELKKKYTGNGQKIYTITNTVAVDDDTEEEFTFLFRKPKPASYDRYVKTISNSASKASKTFAFDNIIDISIHAPAKGATAILYNKFHFLCIILYILSAIT